MSKTLDQLVEASKTPGWRGKVAAIVGVSYGLAVIGLCVIFIGFLVLVMYACAAAAIH